MDDIDRSLIKSIVGEYLVLDDDFREVIVGDGVNFYFCVKPENLGGYKGNDDLYTRYGWTFNLTKELSVRIKIDNITHSIYYSGDLEFPLIVEFDNELDEYTKITYPHRNKLDTIERYGKSSVFRFKNGYTRTVNVDLQQFVPSNV